MFLSRIDFRILPIILCLMGMSLFVISSMTMGDMEASDVSFWTPLVKMQFRWFCLGWVAFFFMVFFDYRKLRAWSPFFYGVILFLLVGLFFVEPIQNVHRWYRIGNIMSFQPSEQAKLVLILFLSWFLERKGNQIGTWTSAFQMGLIVGVPFLLILKQPDLGTALVFFPISLSMAYFAGIHKGLLKTVSTIALFILLFASLLFAGFFSHEKMKPFFTLFLKEYQYERLNPNSYHQQAAQTAIAIGGLTGTGWRKSEFAGRKWLPMAHTDSVFAALGEEFGILGLGFLLFLFYALIYFSFQVAVVAKDPFGQFLAVGLAAYLAMHVLVNSAMMCALLPISGVPLIFLTYGGSSVLTTMAAIGLLQSIYSRRFMF